MTSTIKIHEKDKVFQIATKEGWVEQTGLQAKVDGIDFAICPLKKGSNTFIQVSEVEKAKSYMLEKYGERPEIKDFEEEGK
ncbi:hypothetical protein QLI93_001592 [Listeria monocytogenes]|nr:hypothetical protein [Listeria monocytogenes]